MSSSNPDLFSGPKFDYIIIGGGTAGLVIANRLSAIPSLNILVLEAGPAAFEEPLINIPGRCGESIGTKYDWQFETTPQEGINGRKLKWPRGKVLGGTSALNFMTWNRGCREDYDAWEKLGNEGWGWEGILPFFKRSEKFSKPTEDQQEEGRLYFNEESHGASGPIHTAYPKEFGASHPHWHSTLQNLGVEINKSHFSGSNVGAWTSLTSVDPETRRRCYSATGYYQPVASRLNLKVVTEAVVEEIIIERVEGEWTATGVQFSHEGVGHSVKATQEVIVCAGSVQSPQLLEISGIGDPAVLRAAGIEVKVANSNVGENLQEHMLTASIYEISPEIHTADDLRASPELLASAMEEYTKSASGPLTEIPVSVCYLPLDKIITTSCFKSIVSAIPRAPRTGDPYPALRHKTLTEQFSPGTRLGQVEFNFDRSNYSPYFTAEPGKKYATMLQMLQYPMSVGSIHIPSKGSKRQTTVHDKPIIDPKYYQGEGGEVDFQVMVAAQEFGHRLTETEPLASIIVKRVFPPLPPLNSNEKKGQKELFEEYVRNYTIIDWHPIGTCAMGPRPGEEGIGGVIDARLRVYGVKGLRVVDASIIPLHVSAHIQATVYAIGEKGASMILEDYEKVLEEQQTRSAK